MSDWPRDPDEGNEREWDDDDYDHDFKGWREFDDGLGGETVCTKCGIGAMAESMRRME